MWFITSTALWATFLLDLLSINVFWGYAGYCQNFRKILYSFTSVTIENRGEGWWGWVPRRMVETNKNWNYKKNDSTFYILSIFTSWQTLTNLTSGQFRLWLIYRSYHSKAKNIPLAYIVFVFLFICWFVCLFVNSFILPSFTLVEFSTKFWLISIPCI